MRRGHARTRYPRTLLAFAVITCCATAARADTETFTATATVTKGEASASAPVTVAITKYASESEIADVRTAAQDGGAGALQKALSGLGDAGFIQLGDRRTAIKLAANRSTAAGRLITILTAEPMLFLGAGIPAAKPVTGFDVAIAILDLDAAGGKGELAPAAKVGIDTGGAIVIEDYGATVIWLTSVATAK